MTEDIDALLARLDAPRYNETPDQAAARCAEKWGTRVTIYRVGTACPSVFIAEKEGE